MKQNAPFEENDFVEWRNLAFKNPLIIDMIISIEKNSECFFVRLSTAK